MILAASPASLAVVRGSNPENTKPGGMLLPFLLGLGAFTFVGIGGRISVTELLCCATLLFTFSQTSFRISSLRWLVPGVLVLLLGAWIGDLEHTGGIRSGSFASLAANYLVLALLVGVISRLLILSAGRAAIPLLGGAVFGQLVGFGLTPTASAMVDPWKFSIGWAATVSALLIVHVARKRGWNRGFALVVVLALASLNFAMGARSTGALIVVCGLLALHRRSVGSRRKRTTFALVLLASIGLVVATLAYEGIGSSGSLGVAAADKLVTQSGDYGILFGARKELVMLAAAWAASPLFGWGSMAAVDVEVRMQSLSWFLHHGYAISFSDYLRLVTAVELPLHSVLLGALVTAGVFGIPLSIFLFRTALIGIRGCFEKRDILGLFITLSGMTHLLTSPLGDTTRFVVALACAYGVYWLHTERVQRKSPVLSAASPGVTERALHERVS